MSTQLVKFKRIAIFLVGISTVSIPAMVHADWSIKGLGTLGGKSSFASDINDSGQVVGNFYNASGSSHAFITGTNGIGMMDLGTMGGLNSFALGINNSGQVVGSSGIADGADHAFITGPNDGIGMTDLGTLGGRYSFAYGINDSGQVVGSSYLAGNITAHAFITGPNGKGMTDLGTLGGESSGAYGINDFGQVVGSSYLAADNITQHAFITGSNGMGMTDLGTLDDARNFYFPSDINNSGQVVGYSILNEISPPYGFKTGPNGIDMTDFGNLGGDGSVANGINDSGEVVGVAGTATKEWHSFIFSHGEMTDLSILTSVVSAGWTELVAVSINNNGQIVGSGYHHGNHEAFLLSYIPAVPELEAYLMLLGGLGLIGYLARRRKETVI